MTKRTMSKGWSVGRKPVPRSSGTPLLALQGVDGVEADDLAVTE